MHIIVDAHEDLAHNIQSFGRDYTRPVAETRRLEKDSPTVKYAGESLFGFPEYQQGKIALIFATLFAAPRRYQVDGWTKYSYENEDEAHRLYRNQIDIYRRLTEEHPDKFEIIRNTPDLNLLLSKWQDTEEKKPRPTGMVLLMEGADSIRSPEELEEWWELGLRIIGPAWVGTRYSGGWHEPGPLTDAGRELLSAMAEYNFTLDLSHMDEKAVFEALDIYEGALIASHSNAEALLPNSGTNRHLSDHVIQGIIERDGVIGVALFNAYLKVDWKQADGRDQISLKNFVAHIDHICQLAGDANHVGIGSDFDGGFGLDSVPNDINTVADLQKIAPLLSERGYTENNIAAILGENFINLLKKNLPSS